MNILHKIAILHNINKNKDNVEYSFFKNKEGKSSPVVHRVTINQDDSFISIQMHRDYYLDTFFKPLFNGYKNLHRTARNRSH